MHGFLVCDGLEVAFDVSVNESTKELSKNGVLHCHIHGFLVCDGLEVAFDVSVNKSTKELSKDGVLVIMVCRSVTGRGSQVSRNIAGIEFRLA
jgi:hypothetical protein